MYYLSKYFCCRTLGLAKHHFVPALNIKRSSSSEYLYIKDYSGTKEIMLIHEKTRNSLSLDMMSYLTENITKDKDNPDLRAIILSSRGPVFSAGHNLKEFFQKNSNSCDKSREVFQKATELMMSIIKCPVPVIAKVNGLAAAAGCQLVATCDILVCSNTSKFSTPGANFGIFCSTPGIALGRCVPKAKAMYMLLTGIPISAEEAYKSGLVTKVVPEEKLNEEVQHIVDQIKIKSRRVVTLGKEFYYKQIELGINEAYQLGEEKMVENVNLPDGQEGVKSFVEKRKPTWSHSDKSFTKACVPHIN